MVSFHPSVSVVLPPVLTHKQEELLISVLDNAVYHLSVQESIIHS